MLRTSSSHPASRIDNVESTPSSDHRLRSPASFFFFNGFVLGFRVLGIFVFFPFFMV